MNNFTVNISADDIMSQRENESSNTFKTSFNVNNYLQARLGENETTKDITIRLLPFSPSGGSPFHKVYMHQFKVSKEVSPSGWKRFPCPVKNKLGDSCPFCETAEMAHSLKKEANSEIDKKRYNDIEMSCYAKPMWVVRCIERGHEADGVKFWIFSDSKQKDGIYDKIYAIFKKRLEKGKVIFDLNQGKDLCLTLTKDSLGRTKINITDDEELTPLTDNYEQGLAWINDEKKWTDVYKVKPYDYMSIILKGGVPVFDNETKKYVAKGQQNETNTNEVKPIAETQTNTASIDINTNKQTLSDNNSASQFNVTCEYDDDDSLPF